MSSRYGIPFIDTLNSLNLLAQKCAPGFYRDAIGLFLGKCVPCNCHGHSDQCLDGSGICLVSSMQIIGILKWLLIDSKSHLNEGLFLGAATFMKNLASVCILLNVFTF